MGLTFASQVSEKKPELSRAELIARADAVFDRLASVDGLKPGWARVQNRSPHAGTDRQTVNDFAATSDLHLQMLAGELRDQAYVPGGVRRFSIPKKSGRGRRELGMLCVRDRIVQSALLLELVPILEREFEHSSHGYRPGRSVQSAAAQISSLYLDGWRHVVEADIRGFFDAVPHSLMLEDLAALFPNTDLLRLFDSWLDLSATPDCGLVQGAPISPLLANLYLDHLDEEMERRGVRIVRFADDFILLARSRKKAEHLLIEVADVLKQRGLELHPGKSGVTDFDRGFSFLGLNFLKSMIFTDRHEAEADAWDGAMDAALAKDEGVARDEISGDVRQFRNRDFGKVVESPSAPLLPPEAPVVAEAPWVRRAEDGMRALSPRSRALHLHGKGRVLGARNAAFVVREGGEEIWHCLASRVDRVDIGPHAGFDDEAVRHALETDTPIRLLDGWGRTTGVVEPAVGSGAALRRSDRHLAQARHIIDPEANMVLAREFVRGKIDNQRSVMQRWANNARKAQRNAKRKLARRDRFVAVADKLVGRFETQIYKVENATSLNTLLGLEGDTTKAFFKALRFALIGWKFEKRQRRPAPDAVNAVLNWLSHLLTRDVGIAIERYGLHAGFAHLHNVQGDRASLAFDLMEELRPLLVEALALTLFNSGELGPEHFFDRPGKRSIGITSDGSGLLIRRYEEWMTREKLMRPADDTATSWRGVIDAQVRTYAGHVQGGPRYHAYDAKA